MLTLSLSLSLALQNNPFVRPTFIDLHTLHYFSPQRQVYIIPFLVYIIIHVYVCIFFIRRHFNTFIYYVYLLLGNTHITLYNIDHVILKLGTFKMSVNNIEKHYMIMNLDPMYNHTHIYHTRAFCLYILFNSVSYIPLVVVYTILYIYIFYIPHAS